MNSENEWEPEIWSEKFIDRAYLLLQRQSGKLEKSSFINMVEMLSKESKPLFQLLEGIFGEVDGLLTNIQALILKNFNFNKRYQMKVRDNLEESLSCLRNLCEKSEMFHQFKIDQRIKAEFDNMKSQCEALERENESTFLQNIDLQDKIKELEKHAEAEPKQMPATKGEVEEMFKSHQVFVENSMKKPLEMKINQRIEIDDLKNEIEFLRTEIRKKNDKIIELNDQLTKAKNTLEKKTRLAKDLKSKNKQLKKENQKLERQICTPLNKIEEENKRLREDPRYKDPKFQPLINFICDLNRQLKDLKVEKDDIFQKLEEISSETNIEGTKSKKRAQGSNSRFSSNVNHGNHTISEEGDLQSKLSKSILKSKNKKIKATKRHSSSIKVDGVGSRGEAEIAENKINSESFSSESWKD